MKIFVWTVTYSRCGRQYSIREGEEVRTVLIACRSLKGEVEKVMAEKGVSVAETIWLEAGLHERPKELRQTIIDKLQALTEPSLVLFTLGHCGGALKEIPSGPHTLVAPKVEDCLSFVLGSEQKRSEIQKSGWACFVTPGWLEGSLKFLADRQSQIEKYGQKKADRLLKAYFGSYKRLLFIETGAYNPDDFVGQVSEGAAIAGLEMGRVQGDLTWLGKLFDEAPDKEGFVVALPGTILDIASSAGEI